MNTATNFDDLRALYNTLSTRQRVTDVVNMVVLDDPHGFGEIVIQHDALVALNPDNLFSGRYQGDAVRTAFMQALNAAAETADPDASWLLFAPSFGRLGAVALRARQSGEGIVVHAA